MARNADTKLFCSGRIRLSSAFKKCDEAGAMQFGGCRSNELDGCLLSGAFRCLVIIYHREKREGSSHHCLFQRGLDGDFDLTLRPPMRPLGVSLTVIDGRACIIVALFLH